MLLIEENASSKGGGGGTRKSPDVVTYSKYVHGSIFSIPNWKANALLFSNDYDSLSMSIYGFLKSFLGIEEKLRQILNVEKYGSLRKAEDNEEGSSSLLSSPSILSFSQQLHSNSNIKNNNYSNAVRNNRNKNPCCYPSVAANPSHTALMQIQRLSSLSSKTASGTNQGAIDNRIEQAMDLVKSHLMNAVRSEVEELKERIVKLEDVISHLQNENDFLKANVSQEVLTQLPPTSHAHHQILSSAATQGNTQQPGGGLSPISTPLPSGNNTQQQQQQQPL